MRNGKSKKILMYTNDKIYTTERMTGGIKRFKMLYEGLINNGYDVTLYCGETKDVLNKYNKKAYSIFLDEKKSKLFAGIGIFLKNRMLIKKLKKENYDEVIVFDVPTAIGLCLEKIKNINLFMRQDLVEYRKVMLEEQGRGRLYKSLYLKIMSYCEYLCCKRAKKIIVQCQYDMDNLINRHKKIADRIKKKSYVQINNVNAFWIVEKSSKSIQLKVDTDNCFSIGYIGDFSNTRKGHDLLLPVLRKMIDNGQKIKTFIIGDGILLNEVKENYKEYKNIVFLGKLGNVNDIIRQVDLIVVPSKADSCPNTVLESLYNKTVVIGSNTGGIPEILGDNALFELNIDSLYNKINDLYREKTLLDELKKNQNQRREELCFDWVKKIINIIGV